MKWLPLATIAAKVQAGELKAVDLVEQSLKVIADKAEYQAVIATLTDNARARAKDIDERVSRGEQVGRLAGVPFIAKDNFLVFGAETTAASNILKGFQAPYQSTVVDRLETEGAICVAKANLDAFGHGGSTENSDFFTTKHPRDMNKVAGGSSGGSAAAVALEMVPFAIGTDTGGSTRQPASFVGCVGYKPTYGLMSRSGIVAMASSTDTVGTLARTVDDAALVIDIMAGRDPLDSTTIERDEAGYVDISDDLRGKKIGIVEELNDKSVEPGVQARISAAIDSFKAAGASVESVSVPTIRSSLAAYYIIVPAEVSSNLARYDGQRFGYNAADATDLETSYSLSRDQGFGKEAKRRIMIGTYVLSSGYYDAYYKKAQLVRTKLIDEFAAAFEKYDLLLGAVAPTTAFKIGERASDPMRMYLVDVMVVGPSLAGIPAVSVPCGLADDMPVGLQLMAPQRADRQLLGLAKAAEKVLGMKLLPLIELIVAGLVLLGLIYSAWRLKRRPRKLNQGYFRQRWQDAQKLCAHEETWPLAIINADKLVEEALKKCKYKGKTMGEKLVSAQHDIKSNDTIWFGHKLRNKLVHEDLKKLKQRDVKDALTGFREALKDLGALRSEAKDD